MPRQLTHRPASLALLLLLSACGEPTSPARIRTVTLGLPSALDLDTGKLDSIPGPGRGNEVELYLRSGAPWVASVPGITIAIPDSTPPSVETCSNATGWTYFESPVTSMPPVSYVCFKTSEAAVTWLKLERVGSSTDELLITFEVAH